MRTAKGLGSSLEALKAGLKRKMMMAEQKEKPFGQLVYLKGCRGIG
jgi:hypothetical protein